MVTLLGTSVPRSHSEIGSDGELSCLWGGALTGIGVFTYGQREIGRLDTWKSLPAYDAAGSVDGVDDSYLALHAGGAGSFVIGRSEAGIYFAVNVNTSDGTTRRDAAVQLARLIFRSLGRPTTTLARLVGCRVPPFPAGSDDAARDTACKGLVPPDGSSTVTTVGSAKYPTTPGRLHVQNSAYGTILDYPAADCVQTPFGVAVQAGLDLQLRPDGTADHLLPATADMWAYVTAGRRSRPFAKAGGSLALSGGDAYAAGVSAYGYIANSPGESSGRGVRGDLQLYAVSITTGTDGRSGTMTLDSGGVNGTDTITWSCDG